MASSCPTFASSLSTLSRRKICDLARLPKPCSRRDVFNSSPAGRRSSTFAEASKDVNSNSEKPTDSTEESPTREFPLEVQVSPHLKNLISSPDSEGKSSGSASSLIEQNLQKRRNKKKQKLLEDPSTEKKEEANESGNVSSPAQEEKETTTGLKLQSNFEESWKKWNILFPSALDWFSGPDGESLRGLGPQMEAIMASKMFSQTTREEYDPRLQDADLLSSVLLDGGVLIAHCGYFCNGFISFGVLQRGSIDEAQREYQARLDQNLPGFVCILAETDPLGMFPPDPDSEGLGPNPRPLLAVIFLPVHELVTFSLPPPILAGASLILAGASALCAFQVPQISPAGAPSALLAAIPALSLLLVALAGHCGRYVAARRYGTEKVLSFPLLLPSPAIGSLGCFSFAKGCSPSRAAAMDVALGSLLGGSGASALLLLLGLLSGQNPALSSLSGLVFAPENTFFLFPWLGRAAADSAAVILAGTEDSPALIALNPFTFGGFLGLQFSLADTGQFGSS